MWLLVFVVVDNLQVALLLTEGGCSVMSSLPKWIIDVGTQQNWSCGIELTKR